MSSSRGRASLSECGHCRRVSTESRLCSSAMQRIVIHVTRYELVFRFSGSGVYSIVKRQHMRVPRKCGCIRTRLGIQSSLSLSLSLHLSGVPCGLDVCGPFRQKVSVPMDRTAMLRYLF